MIAVAPCFACHGEKQVGLTLGWTRATHTSPPESIDVMRECPFCHGSGKMDGVNRNDREHWADQDRSEIEQEIALRCLED